MRRLSYSELHCMNGLAYDGFKSQKILKVNYYEVQELYNEYVFLNEVIYTYGRNVYEESVYVKFVFDHIVAVFELHDLVQSYPLSKKVQNLYLASQIQVEMLLEGFYV